MYGFILLFSLAIFLYSIFGGGLEKLPLSAPLLFVITGLVLGPLVLNLVDIKISGENYETLANLALALVLFTGASKINIEVLKSSLAIPSRLLMIGLPLTIIAGLFAGYLVFNNFLWIELAILATVLAPTDAALGEAVVTNKVVPAKIREALNMESGLNDGISVPIFLLLIAIFKAHAVEDVSIAFAMGLFAKEIGIGLVAGFAILFFGSKLLVFAEERKWIAEAWKPVIIIALAFSCFSLADLFGGSGFIACFTGGFVYGAVNKKYKSNLEKHAEGLGNAITFVIWIIFGSFVISSYIHNFTWQIVLYAVLSLTLVRIIPVLISLTKSRCSVKEELFIGWFGPRGLASIVFAIMLLDVKLPHLETVIPTILCTVLLSVILHGITANPFANSFNKKSIRKDAPATD